MLKNLQKAVALLRSARPFLKRALSKYHYPVMHENIDYLIRDVELLIAALDRGETLPR